MQTNSTPNVVRPIPTIANTIFLINGLIASKIILRTLPLASFMSLSHENESMAFNKPSRMPCFFDIFLTAP